MTGEMATGNADSSGSDWVEIIEPESRQIVFANPVTGEVLFEPPEGVSIKPMSDNQWWELLDTSSDTYYYHNPHTQETVWEKPTAADIISLTRLQQVGSQGHKKPKPLKPIRKTSDLFAQPLESLSPLNVEYNGHRFSAFDPDVPNEESRESTVSSFGSTTSTSTSTCSSAVTNSTSSASAGQRVGRDKDHSDSNSLFVTKGSYTRSTLPKTKSTQYTAHGGSVKQGSGYHSLSRDKDGKGTHRSSLDGSSQGKNETETSRYSAFTVISVSDVPSLTAVESEPSISSSRKAPPVPNSHPIRKKTSLPGITTTLEYYKDGRTNSALVRPPPIPPAPPGMPRSASLMADSLDKFDDLAQHKRGLFFRKKVTIANMLCWTKEPIKQPMILTRDKTQRKEAIDVFKLVLQFMGDRRSKIKDPDAIALQITSRVWQRKGLADEVYIQLCRQTTGNTKPESLHRGWELMTICLAFFPPTVKFRSYLEGYLWKHVDSSPENKGVPVETYATYCHKRIEKMTQSGPKKGLKKPTIEEIKHAKAQPFHPSLFGTTLEEAMEIQAATYPDLDIPWIVTELCETVVRLQGPFTEGIFRVPGDIDEVNLLKLHVDKGHSPPYTLLDPHIPASLLKLWFRELEDPLIPQNYYQSCVDNCSHVNNILSLVDSLPDLNRRVLFYLIGFLQKFVGDENIQVTRMSVDNIAMVWAPNFLRCPSDDHVLIFENTRKEMSFMRLLITNLHTNA